MCGTGTCANCQQNQYLQNMNYNYGPGLANGGYVYTTSNNSGNNYSLGINGQLGQSGQWTQGVNPVSQIAKHVYYGTIQDPITHAESRITSVKVGYSFYSNYDIINGITTENIVIEGKLFSDDPKGDYPLKFIDHDEKVILLKLMNVACDGPNNSLTVVVIDNLEYLELMHEHTTKENAVIN